jgi:hypothetical protein
MHSLSNAVPRRLIRRLRLRALGITTSVKTIRSSSVLRKTGLSNSKVWFGFVRTRETLWRSSARGLKPPYPDFPLMLADSGNAVGRLHTHQRIHLHPEGFLDAQRHVAGQVSLAIEQTGERRARHLKRGGGGPSPTDARVR